MTIDRTFARLSPSKLSGIEASEQIYAGELIPLARDLFQSDPRRLSYETLRVRAEHGITEGWTAPETAWRFTIATQVADAHATEGDRTAIPESMRDQIALLTERCCRDLRRLQVEEVVAIGDTPTHAETPSDAVVLVLQRDGNEAALNRDAREVAILAELTQAAADIGSRARLDLVVSESETRPIREPGQIYTGALLAHSDFLAVMAAEGPVESIGSLVQSARAALDQEGVRLNAYLVERTVQFARSHPAPA